MMHDPSAVIAITDRDAFEFRQAPLRVICEGDEIGQTVAETQSGRRPVNVAVGVDSARVRKIFLDICAQADTIRNKRIAAT
jgi:inosine-uridine nucleoside N-ribohydrolase